MTSAVDSNVLFDILLTDPKFGQASEQALRACLRDGPVLVCAVVYAELAAAMAADDVDRFLSDFHWARRTGWHGVKRTTSPPSCVSQRVG